MSASTEPMIRPRPAPAFRRSGSWAAWVAFVAIILLYWWSVRAVGGLGGMDREPPANDYYNHLVAGFTQGHLYMDLPVAAALKTLPDPYDPRQNEAYRLTDASYFRGHYYLYFGVAPAVTLLLPVRLVTGEFLPTPWAILIFTCIGFVAMAGLFMALRQRYFPDSPGWTAPVGILVLGIASTADVLLRRPFFWELATAGGFAFAMLALAAIYAAVHSSRSQAWWMAVAGLCLGLAVASRPTYVYTLPVLAAAVLARPVGQGRWRILLAAGVPLALVGAGVFWYNHARFGNGFEFGHNYLLSVAYESKVRLFGWDHVWFNARMYFTRLGAWSWQPPFFAPVPVLRSEMPPGFYTVDDPFGLIPVFPLALLALLGPTALRGRAGAERKQLAAVLVATTGLCVIAGLIILLYVATIPRYAVDFLPAFAILIAVGVLVAAEARSAIVRTGTLLLAIASLAMGTATFCDIGRLLDRSSPNLLRRVTAMTTRVESLYDRLRGIPYGSVELSVSLPHDKDPPATLVTRGKAGDADRVVVEWRGNNEYRFGVQHANAPTLWGRTIVLPGTRTHDVTVSLGSFYPELEHGFFSGANYQTATWLQHHADVTVDGQRAISTFAPFRPERHGWADVTFSPLVTTTRAVAVDPRRVPGDMVPNIFLNLTTAGGASTGKQSIARVRTDEGVDELTLEPDGRGMARLAYTHSTEKPRSASAFPLGAGAHRVELRGTENGWAPPVTSDHRLLVWIDGILRWDTVAPAFGAAPDAVTFGENLADSKFTLAAPDGTRRGGPLLLRVMLPKGVKNAWIPLLSTGHAEAGDVLSIDYMSIDAVQVRFDHWGAPLIVGKTIQLDENVGHDFEVWLPSFALEHFGLAGSGDVVVKIDGQEAIRTASAVFGFAPDELALGQNPLHATMDDRYFRGAFVQQVWLGR